MNYLVIICALISICLVVISKEKGLSVAYPTLMIMLTIVLNLVSNTMNERKLKKDKVNIDDIKKWNIKSIKTTT